MSVELAAAARIVIFATFAVSASQKATAVSRFAEQVADYGLFPYRATKAAAACVIVIEVVMAVAILVPSTAVTASMAAAALLAAFAAVQIRVLHAGSQISCGCFGGQGDLDRVDKHSIVRTLLLASVALLGVFAGGGAMTPAVVPIVIALVCVVFVGSELTRLLTDVAEAERDLAAQGQVD